MWPFSLMTDNGKALLWLLRKDPQGWVEYNDTWQHKATNLEIDLMGMAFRHARFIESEDHFPLSRRDRRKLWWACRRHQMGQAWHRRREFIEKHRHGGVAQAAVFKWAITHGYMKEGLPTEQPPESYRTSTN